MGDLSGQFPGLWPHLLSANPVETHFCQLYVGKELTHRLHLLSSAFLSVGSSPRPGSLGLEKRSHCGQGQPSAGWDTKEPGLPQKSQPVLLGLQNLLPALGGTNLPPLPTDQ